MLIKHAAVNNTVRDGKMAATQKVRKNPVCLYMHLLFGGSDSLSFLREIIDA